jgi:protein-tyrosine phosphatase
VDGGVWEILREEALDRVAIADAACERVLFVCTGNVCRSPIAEGLFRRMIADRLGTEPTPAALERHGFRVASAGTAELGASPASPEAVAAAARCGADISEHRSRPLTPALLDEADRVYVMTAAQQRIIVKYAPDAWTRIELLDRTGEDVPDPFRQPPEVYARTAERIRAALAPLVDELIA